jgi:glycosyltransferase involved in cell wall biosynthesis
MTTMPRVVLMANNIDEVGGAQRVVHVVAQELGRRGYAVDLVGVAPFEPRHAYVAEPAFRRFTLMSEPWPAPPRDSRLGTRLRPSVRRLIARRARLQSEAVAALRAVLADGPPGIVVTAQLWAMEHLAQVPHDDWAVIGQYHSSFEAAAAGRDLPRALELYEDVDLFALLTPEDAERFRQAGLNNTRWLPNPLAFWPAEPAAPGDGPGGTVTYLGRLSAEKGPRFLVEAWGSIAAGHPDWRLRIVGSGPEEASVRAQAAALPAGGDRVDFVAPVTDSEAELRDASILVMPSLTEGLPLALAEAMALGLPCVATDCSSGVRLLTEDGAAARIVPRAEPGALAQALSALMGSSRERLELGGRARGAVARFRAELVIDEWERMIADVLR